MPKDIEFIPPDYSKDEDDDIDESIVTEDESKIDSIIEHQLFSESNKLSEKYKKEEKKEMTWGNPSQPIGGQSTPWGTSSGLGSSIWEQKPPTSWEQPKTTPFGQSQPTNIWGTAASKEKTAINRSKRVIFCDFLDCIVETYQSNKTPGYLPRDIYDMIPRFDVWEKLKAFNPERIYAMIPKNLIPSTNGSEAWQIALSYFCCSLSSYIRVPYQNCQILAQSVIGQPKKDIMLSVIDNKQSPINRADIVCIGIYSGVNGQSNIDIQAAENCKIDYIDLYNLLNNMY